MTAAILNKMFSKIINNHVHVYMWTHARTCTLSSLHKVGTKLILITRALIGVILLMLLQRNKPCSYLVSKYYFIELAPCDDKTVQLLKKERTKKRKDS